jgi:hypothetical protein
MTSVGRLTRAITEATEKVFPDPVIPSSTWCRSPALRPRTMASIASGWSPRGS